MVPDERGFDTETRGVNELNLAEIRDEYKKLALLFGIQSTENRNLKIELSQLRLWAGELGITTTAIKKIRREVVTRYLQGLKPLKRKRGRPTPFHQLAITAQLLGMYELREIRSQKFKPWLRKLIQDEFESCGKSLTTNKREIERLIQKHATQVTRYKKSVT